MKIMFLTGKTGYTRSPVPMDIVPIPDPTRETSTKPERVGSSISAGTGGPTHPYCAPILQFFSAASDAATADRQIPNRTFSSIS